VAEALGRFPGDYKNRPVGRHLTPHGLRRTLNSLLRAANKDPAKTRAALGWKQETTQDGYTEVNADDLEGLRLDSLDDVVTPIYSWRSD
jgi:integrase